MILETPTKILFCLTLFLQTSSDVFSQVFSDMSAFHMSFQQTFYEERDLFMNFAAPDAVCLLDDKMKKKIKSKTKEKGVFGEVERLRFDAASAGADLATRTTQARRGCPCENSRSAAVSNVTLDKSSQNIAKFRKPHRWSFLAE